MAKTLILGSGISALTHLFYDRDARALAGPAALVGGMFKTSPHFGPQYLWADSTTDAFLRELKIPLTTENVRVGIYHKKHLLTPGNKLSNESEREIRDRYALKTRGTKAKSSFMSSGKSEYEVFTAPLEKVVSTLLTITKKQLIPSSAVNIFTGSRFVQDNFGDMYSYDDTLISTIPAPSFLAIAKFDGAQHLKAADKLYAIAPASTCEAWVKKAIEKKLSYVYCPDASEPWHRVSFVRIEDALCGVFEFTAKADTIRFSISAMRSFFSRTTLQPKGQIISGKEVLLGMPGNIKFAGRYAEWDHAVKFNDVLKRVIF